MPQAACISPYAGHTWYIGRWLPWVILAPLGDTGPPGWYCPPWVIAPECQQDGFVKSASPDWGGRNLTAVRLWGGPGIHPWKALLSVFKGCFAIVYSRFSPTSVPGTAYKTSKNMFRIISCCTSSAVHYRARSQEKARQKTRPEICGKNIRNARGINIKVHVEHHSSNN